jgi:hypothetical protein
MATKEMPNKIVFLISFALAQVSTSSFAGDLPVRPLAKVGDCPSGYFTSGGYCKPNGNARFAIPKHGDCPAGYLSSGNYCLAGYNARYTLTKSGYCPSGYISSGAYCLSSQ